MEEYPMPSEPTSRPANLIPTTLADKPTPPWGRALAIAAAVVFFISSVFPVVAGFVKDREAWPEWWGVLDVSTALVLAILVLAVMALANGRVNKGAEEASYRAYRVLIHGVFGLLVVFFLWGNEIAWGNCLTGFGWRYWLLLYALPAWFTVFGITAAPNGASTVSPLT
jgi:hypothetical protein